MTKRQHIARINNLIKRLEQGELVSNKMLSTVLTVKQIDEMKQSWQQEKRTRKQQKPAFVTEYQKLLRIAQFLENRYERMHGLKHGTDQQRNRMSEKADSAYEAALEHISEDYSRFAEWFDRAPLTSRQTPDAPLVLSEESACADNMPRVVGSNSWHSEDVQHRYNVRTRKLTVRGTGVKPGTMTKRDVKKYALYSALEVLNPPVIETPLVTSFSSLRTRATPDFSQIKF